MPRAAPRFRQADLTKALKGARAAGMDVARVEIDPSGKIVIITTSTESTEQVTDFDSWKARHHARSA